MCAHGTTVDLDVTVPARLSHTGQDRPATKPIDACIAPIVAALNAGGVRTDSCCCGHGDMPGEIILNDGRVLKVLPPEFLADRMARLAQGGDDE